MSVDLILRSPHSYALKAAFARKSGIAGINMFDLTGDTKDSKLIKAARAQLLCTSAEQRGRAPRG